jgi:hypothetical protein
MKFFMVSIWTLVFFAFQQQGFSQILSQNKTQITKSWRDPETQVKIGQFKKILVVAFVKDQANRSVVENDIAKILKGKAVPSYQYLGEDKVTLTEEELSAKIADDGFDGAIVMQLFDPNKQLGYIPGTGTYPAQYKSFTPHYSGVSQKYYDEDYLKNHSMYAVETNIYSLKDNKLIWNGITTSTDPKNLDKMVASIGKVIIDEMKKQGFLY